MPRTVNGAHRLRGAVAAAFNDPAAKQLLRDVIRESGH
jgi:hypothetical protein